jgi:hypothetical protein
MSKTMMVEMHKSELTLPNAIHLLAGHSGTVANTVKLEVPIHALEDATSGDGLLKLGNANGHFRCSAGLHAE